MWALSAFPAFCETGHRSFYQPGQNGTIFWLLSEIQLAPVAMNYFRISTAQNTKQNTKKKTKAYIQKLFQVLLARAWPWTISKHALALAGQAEAKPGNFITNQPLGSPWSPILKIFSLRQASFTRSRNISFMIWSHLVQTFVAVLLKRYLWKSRVTNV